MINIKGVRSDEAGGLFTLKIAGTQDALPLLAEADALIESFEVLHGTMDDVFLHVT